MTTVDVRDAKTRLSELLELVEAGEEIVIARAGRPIAELRPVERPQLMLGRFAHLGPVPEDLFEPLSGESLARWEDGGADDPPTSRDS